MEFCPKCGAVLVHKKSSNECPRCKYVKKGATSLATSEKTFEKKEVAIVKDKDKSMDVMPTTYEKCPKCGHDKAYFWSVQTRGSDEAETKFFKCVKCAHTRRDYS